jgi:hypothetical protein
MHPMQEINLAYEYQTLLKDGFTAEEAREEIKAILETEYRREVLSEVNELLLYGWNEVISDILANIEALLHRMANSMVLN